MKKSNEENLEQEREKLNKLADEAMKKGIPFDQDEALMEQNRIVDDLVVRIQREKEKQRKQKER
jgi:polyhydroxyalkanoate synthesis regulator phasin